MARYDQQWPAMTMIKYYFHCGPHDHQCTVGNLEGSDGHHSASLLYTAMQTEGLTASFISHLFQICRFVRQVSQCGAVCTEQTHNIQLQQAVHTRCSLTTGRSPEQLRNIITSTELLYIGIIIIDIGINTTVQSTSNWRAWASVTPSVVCTVLPGVLGVAASCSHLKARKW